MFNVEGRKAGVYCKQHAEDSMENVVTRRCLDDSCTSRPSFSVAGTRTAACCKQHAVDGMVNVRGRRSSYESCTETPSFNVDGHNTPATASNMLLTAWWTSLLLVVLTTPVLGDQAGVYCQRVAQLYAATIGVTSLASHGSTSELSARWRVVRECRSGD